MIRWINRTVMLHLIAIAVVGLPLDQAWAASMAAARLVSSKGKVETMLAATAGWQKAETGMELPQGAVVMTGEDGRASLLMADETLVKLNRNTKFIIKEVSNRAGWNRLQGITPVALSSERTRVSLENGEAWFLNKNRDADLEVETSTVAAAIRGTEFNIRKDADASVQVVVLEGHVRVTNAQGALDLGPGDVSVTQPGSAPTKSLLLRTADAVQWTVVLPSLFTSRDLKFTSYDAGVLAAEEKSLSEKESSGSASREERIRHGLVLRDLGKLEQAERLFQEVSKQNPAGDKEARTGLGWVLLDRALYPEAFEAFQGVGGNDATAAAGMILALLGMEKPVEAEKLYQTATAKVPANTLLATVGAWLDITSGRLTAADNTLTALTGRDPNLPVAWELSSLVCLALDKRDESRQAAGKAVAMLPWSPTPLIVKSYIEQATFDLEASEGSLRQALELEGGNVTALVSLARIKFGQGYAEAAADILDKAERLAPGNPEAVNLRGFIALAQRDAKAGELFSEVARLSPEMAEPHLGAALSRMRSGDDAGALEEISTAVLLEPRRAMLRSYWAKMLYQLERYQKALEVLEVAKNIDPNDPTPELYRALALNDLNQYTAAISALQAAIRLNDNRAVYRSRFLLDQDLAVKNVNLAHLFYKLDVTDWSTSLAADSIKDDYGNSAAHLFYAGSLLLDPERSLARDSETLLARLLQPANANTFNSFNEYTAFFEQPSLNASLKLKGGNLKTLGQEVELSGAAPALNLAAQLSVANGETDGWRQTNFQDNKVLIGLVKWDLAPGHSLLLSGQAFDQERGDKLSPLYEYDAPAEPRNRLDSELARYEAGYHYAPTIGIDFLLHYSHSALQQESSLYDLLAMGPLTISGAQRTLNGEIVSGLWTELDYDQVQGQGIFRLRDQQIMVGGTYYSGDYRYRLDSQGSLEITPPGGLFFPYNNKLDNKLAQQAQTYFIHDIYRLNPALYLEGAVYADRMETGSVATDRKWTLEEYSPRLGLAWNLSKADVIRLAGFRYLRPFAADRLEPVDIAGIPVYRNGRQGGVVEEGAFAVEHKGEKFFASLGGFYADYYFPEKQASGEIVEWPGISKGAAVRLNLLPLDGVGLFCQYSFKDIEDTDSLSQLPDRYDHLATLGLTWAHASGFATGLNQTYRHLDYRGASKANEEINLTDFWAEYKLKNKKAALLGRVNNVFDQHFNWPTDYYVTPGRLPVREYIVTLDLFY
ncbi:MAG: tetratricopeptide repeat protein [Desulfobulbaceae bacterium]|nr:tetratricopeptide repeat protein [Desulfobulbaceae bacterium]